MGAPRSSARSMQGTWIRDRPGDSRGRFPFRRYHPGACPELGARRALALGISARIAEASVPWGPKRGRVASQG